MGMFDTVHVACPKCKAVKEFQSKAGACSLHNYSSNSVPAEIANSLDGETFDCCGITWTLKAPPQNRVTMRIFNLGGQYD